MTTKQHNDLFEWYTTLDLVKEDGYTPIKVTSLLQFFTLAGKKVVISTESLEAIPDLHYVYLAPPDKDSEPVYYVKPYAGYSVNNLYFYRPDWPMLEVEEACDIFRARCKAGLVWIIMNEEQVADMSALLKRIYKARTKEDGKLPYKLWLQLLENIVGYDEYQAVGKNHTGFRTLCKIYQDKELDIWKQAKASQR
jgi:hypothetical protein